MSETGVKEAEAGGKALADAGYSFDVAHTSLLTRAQVTLAKVLEGIDQKDLPVEKTWRLNERHYGALTGLNKAETAEKHGEAQVGKFLHSLYFLCVTILVLRNFLSQAPNSILSWLDRVKDRGNIGLIILCSFHLTPRVY